MSFVIPSLLEQIRADSTSAIRIQILASRIATALLARSIDQGSRRGFDPDQTGRADGQAIWKTLHSRQSIGEHMPKEHQKSDALFRTLIATAVDGIMVIDEHGIVEIYNSACQRLFGYPAEEVLGRNVSILMPSPYREEHDAYIQHYRKTGERR